MNQPDLAGRVALLTGASGGIGGALGRRLIAAGARCAFTFGTHPGQAQDLAREAEELGLDAMALGGGVAPGLADVALVVVQEQDAGAALARDRGTEVDAILGGQADRLGRRLRAGATALARRELIEQYGERLRDLTDPIACNYATLRCGLSFEQHSVSYIRWLLTTLEGTPAGAANSAMAAEPHGVQPGSRRP